MAEPAATESASNSRRTNVLLGVALWLTTMVLYWPTAGYEFIHFDDPIFVIHNEHVNQGFTAEGIRWAFTKGEIDYWRPLTWLSHMADVHFFGMNPGPHHVTSIVIHAVNAVLLFVVFQVALGNRWAAFLIAALFAWHPLHVESVAWIAERKDVLSGFFWHACFLFYALYAKAGKKRFYWLALGMFGLGLMSKPMIVTLPCQLLLLDLWPFRRWENGFANWRRLVGEKIPFLALAVVASAFAYYAQRSVGEMAEGSVPAFTMRLGNAVLAYGSYLSHTILPVDLGVFYPFPETIATAPFGMSLLVVLGVTIAVIVRWRTNPEWLCGWLFFLGTIVPVVGLLKVGGQASADRYTYIATTGLFWMAALFLFPRGDRQEIRGTPGIVAGFALLLMLGLCRAQIGHWQNSITLFSHTIEVTQNNLVMMNNLARAYLAKGDLDRAQPIYEEIVALRAQHYAHYHLGTIHVHRGDPATAEFHFRAALSVEPSFTPPAFELGRLMFDRRQYREAAILFDRVLKAEPENESAQDYRRRITAVTSTGQ
jgi:protein O-mannosyl-transferase